MARYNSFPLGISFVLRYFFQIVRFLFFSTIKGKYVTCLLFPMELKLLKIPRIRVRLISLEFNNRRNIIEIPRWRNTIELILSLSWEREGGEIKRERERGVFLLRIGKREFPARRLSQRSILYRVYRFPPLVTGMYISRSFVVGKNVFSTCTKIHFFLPPLSAPSESRRDRWASHFRDRGLFRRVFSSFADGIIIASLPVLTGSTLK